MLIGPGRVPDWREQLINECGLAMIDVGDDGDVSGFAYNGLGLMVAAHT